MKILFMGTPDFAVPSLRKLALSRHNIVGVVTGPDQPSGRGLKIRPSSVKKAGLDLALPILQPSELTGAKFVQQIGDLQADVFVVVAFRILPPEVFELPPKGTINLHASLLPKYRGAAPINWAIINGERETGVTTFFIEKNVDTGDMILQREAPIHSEETAGELHDKLANIGADLVLETVDLIEEGRALTVRQTGEPTKAPKLTKDLGRIRWEARHQDIHNLVRGLSPSPAAFTVKDGRMLKILKSRIDEEARTTGAPGEIVSVEQKGGRLGVATGAGCIHLEEVQPEGKRRMAMSEYLKGYSVKVGDKFDR